MQIKLNKCLFIYVTSCVVLSACSSIPYLSSEQKGNKQEKPQVVEIDVNNPNRKKSQTDYNTPTKNNTLPTPHIDQNSSSANISNENYYVEPEVKLSVEKQTNTPHDSFICDDITPYMGTVVGNGECVDLLKTCAKVSHTQYWQEGNQVWGKKIPTGTAIATFENGRYPNRTGYHAALYVSQDEKGIYVWDQWQGKAVHTRLITNTAGKTPGNTADQYRVIK